MKVRAQWIKQLDKKLYSVKERGKKPVRIIVEAERFGHGCLFNVYLPRYISTHTWSFGGNSSVDLCDFIKCFDLIKKDYNL